MTLFQWVACSGLALLAVRELVRWRRGALSARQWALRTAVWIAALFAIADPLLVTRFANAIGIGRGADVVLYGFVLAFLAASFAFASRTVRLEQKVSLLAGRIAMLEARRGPEQPAEPPRG
jgi:hypothetical protein